MQPNPTPTIEPSSNQTTVHGHQPQTGALLSKQQVAKRLNVSTRTVNNLMSDGSLVPIRIRSVLRFSSESVEALIDDSRDSQLEHMNP
jgi:excisionase family DNA binding protein